MRSHRQSWTLSPYLVIFLCSVLVTFSTSLSDDDEELFGSCGKRPFTCGTRTVEVAYPFNTADRPASCGHPNFELNCNSSGSSAITIHVGRKTYVVMGDIDYSAHLITLLDQSLFDRPCPLPSENTDIDATLFSYTDRDVEVTFFFNCTSSILTRLLNIECSSTRPLYFWPNSSLPWWASPCSGVRVRMDSAAVDGLTSNTINYNQALQEGFTVTWNEGVQGSCGECINSGGVCASTPASAPDCSKATNASPENGRKGLIAGVLAGVAVVVFLAICATFMLIQRHKRINEQSKVLKGLDVKPYTFSYAELRAATEGFNPANILGEGGFGSVFKGILSNGRKVAVKKLSTTSNQGKDHFLTEIATISAVQHRNLVKLHGCCVDEENRILVYEYLENCSLDQIIFGKRDLHLDWSKRFNILLGVAKGLAYLHEESSVRIVHRDVKASNILLDADLNPKISDFGLAKLYDDKMSHISTNVAGTFGYLAPEYALRGHLTEKADVFAFGVLALEVVSGRPNCDRLDHNTVYLLEWAWNLLENNQKTEVLDRSLTSFDGEEVNRVIGVALLCTQASPAHRPPMSRVVAMLVGDLEIMDVTERPPYLLLWQCRDVSSSLITAENSDAPYRRHVKELPSFPVWSTDSVETRILSVESIGSCSIDEGRKT